MIKLKTIICMGCGKENPRIVRRDTIEGFRHSEDNLMVCLECQNNAFEFYDK